jgi:hypothetical protein
MAGVGGIVSETPPCASKEKYLRFCTLQASLCTLTIFMNEIRDAVCDPVHLTVFLTVSGRPFSSLSDSLLFTLALSGASHFEIPGATYEAAPNAALGSMIL